MTFSEFGWQQAVAGSGLEKVQETSEELAPLRENRSREEAASRIGAVE